MLHSEVFPRQSRTLKQSLEQNWKTKAAIPKVQSQRSLCQASGLYATWAAERISTAFNEGTCRGVTRKTKNSRRYKADFEALIPNLKTVRARRFAFSRK